MNMSNGMNQREVAEALGLSRAMVQKIEEKALNKIRLMLEKKKIKKEDYIE
jgi:DNA-directed RNA polymerase specialized sigma subunit